MMELNGSMFGIVAVTTSARRAVLRLYLIRVRKRYIRQFHQNDPPQWQLQAGSFNFPLRLPLWLLHTAASNPHGHNHVAVAVSFFGEGAHLAGGLFIF
jgi:hypothetical protein